MHRPAQFAFEPLVLGQAESTARRNQGREGLAVAAETGAHRFGPRLDVVGPHGVDQSVHPLEVLRRPGGGGGVLGRLGVVLAHQEVFFAAAHFEQVDLQFLADHHHLAGPVGDALLRLLHAGAPHRNAGDEQQPGDADRRDGGGLGLDAAIGEQAHERQRAWSCGGGGHEDTSPDSVTDSTLPAELLITSQLNIFVALV